MRCCRLRSVLAANVLSKSKGCHTTCPPSLGYNRARRVTTGLDFSTNTYIRTSFIWIVEAFQKLPEDAPLTVRHSKESIVVIMTVDKQHVHLWFSVMKLSALMQYNYKRKKIKIKSANCEYKKIW